MTCEDKVDAITTAVIRILKVYDPKLAKELEEELYDIESRPNKIPPYSGGPRRANC